MIELNPELLKNALYLFNWTASCWEFYLITRQFRVLSRSSLPECLKDEIKINRNIFEKARKNEVSKLGLNFVQNLLTITILTWIIYNETLAHFWEYLVAFRYSEMTTHLLALYILLMAPLILNLPFTLYNTFIIQQGVKFNTQNLLVFLWNGIKYLFSQHCLWLSLFGYILVFVIITFYISVGYYHDICLWFLILGLCFLYEIVYLKIPPFFYQYILLPSGPLKSEMEKLALQCNYPVRQIVIKENLSGATYLEENIKHIVLHGALLNYNPAEILALFVHELGHWKLNHYKKKNIAKLIFIFLKLSIVYCLWDYHTLYTALGFRWQKPRIIASVAILYFILIPAARFYKYFVYGMIRRIEQEADTFVVQLVEDGESLKKSILHVWKDHLVCPLYDNFYSSWFFGRLPLVERLENIDSQMKDFDSPIEDFE